jgi:hypothetical protein
MCRCESDVCCNLRAEYIDSRIGRLVADQAEPVRREADVARVEGEG